MEAALPSLGNLSFRRTFGPLERDQWEELLSSSHAFLGPGYQELAPRAKWPVILSVTLIIEPSCGYTRTKKIEPPLGDQIASQNSDFLWQLVHHRLPSGIEVFKWNGSGDGQCPFCEALEDSNHILFSCPSVRFLCSCLREIVGHR